jgi:hypothetical protein
MERVTNSISSAKKYFNDPSNKSTIHGLTGMFLCVLGGGIVKYGDRMGLSNKNVRLLVGSVFMLPGTAFLSHSILLDERSSKNKGAKKKEGAEEIDPQLNQEAIDKSRKENISKVFQDLFEGTPYKFNELPERLFTDWSSNESESCIVRLKLPDGSKGERPIAIRVGYNYNEKDVAQRLIVLREHQESGCVYWEQDKAPSNTSLSPQFCKGAFTDPVTGKPNNQDAFNKIHALLKEGKGTDLNDVSWQLLSSPVEVDDTPAGKTKWFFRELFAGSPYKFDSLPQFPKEDTLELEKMTAPVMEWRSAQGHFIAIKVECELTDKNIEAITGENNRKDYQGRRHLQELIVFRSRTDKDGCTWDQISGGQQVVPEFFNGTFIYRISGTFAENKGHANSFASLQQILRGNSGNDLKGRTWKLSQ